MLIYNTNNIFFLVCVVCYGFKQVQKIRPCNHRVCVRCIENIRNNLCPMCKQEIISYLPPNRRIQPTNT